MFSSFHRKILLTIIKSLNRNLPLQGKLDIIIIDETEPCPYLPGQTARMPLRMPLHPLSPDSMDDLLASGNRRTGEFVYRTQCPSCMSCLPIRIDCTQFQFNKHWRREFSRGERHLKTVIGALQNTQDRVDLFNKHRSMRGLARHDASIDLEEYHWGFIKSCFQSFEIAYRKASNALVGLAVCDQGKESLSAVYTFYDPEFRLASVGTYSILKQIEYCKTNDLKFLYLGFYVAGSVHMKYKERFLPQQRLIEGTWREFRGE